jgi:DNA-binding protein HU-beta
VNKTDLIEQVAQSADLSRASASRAVEALFNAIADSLKTGDSVTLTGFGTFSVAERSARNGRNPQTGETIVIAAARKPRFKAGKGLKDALN